MIRSFRAFALGAAVMLLLSGCWDMKSIQDTNYIAALGYDFKDGKYIVYAQLLDFSNVSKPDATKGSASGNVWAGREEGITVIDAMNQLYKTSQQRVFWGQVSSIVFSQEAIKHGVLQYLDGLIRFREIRYTQWVYGTSEPIDRLFTVTPFFNLSPLASILHQPEDNYRQRSFIRPLRLHKMVSELREPGNSLLLPTLTIDREVWKKNGSQDPKLEVTGVHVLTQNEEPVFVQDSELIGLRWMEENSRRGDLVIRKDGKPSASLSIENIQADIQFDEVGSTTQFSIRFSCSATIAEMVEGMTEREIEEGAVEALSSQIRHTFNYGQKKELDLFHLSHELYRKNFPMWSKLTQNGLTSLKDFQLGSIEVKVDMLHSGMYRITKQPKNQY